MLTFTFTNPKVMFCSKDCMDEATKTYLHIEDKVNEFEFQQRIFFKALAICGGSFEKLQQLMDDPELSNKSVFDFDFSDPDDPQFKYHQLIVLNSLLQGRAKPDDVESIANHPLLQLLDTKDKKNTARNFMQRVKRIAVENNYGLEWMTPNMRGGKFLVTSIENINIGTALYLFGSLFNHSCLPNIDRTLVDDKVVFSVRRVIYKDQQLFTDYG